MKKVAKGVVEAADRLETVTEQLKKARARARDKEWRHGESSKRLKRARLAEAEVRQLKRQVADLEASASDSDSESESDDELATVQRPRRDERGRFGAQEWRLRPMQWAQLARRAAQAAWAIERHLATRRPCAGPRKLVRHAEMLVQQRCGMRHLRSFRYT